MDVFVIAFFFASRNEMNSTELCLQFQDCQKGGRGGASPDRGRRRTREKDEDEEEIKTKLAVKRNDQHLSKSICCGMISIYPSPFVALLHVVL